MIKPCGCMEAVVVAGQVVRVDTCPVCLPVGSITWLIENGRQLELFEEEEGTLLRGGLTRDEIVRSIPSEQEAMAVHGLPF